MTCSIVFVSKTGNTELVAQAIRSGMPEESCIYFGAPDDRALDADVIFCGFWTDKGTCSPDMQDFLTRLDKKHVALFATAGFGCSDEYGKKIFTAVREDLPQSAEVDGTFLCQGKMPPAVRQRYEAMQQRDPDDARIAMLIENFDLAQSHPDDADLHAAEEFAQIACEEYESQQK